MNYVLKGKCLDPCKFLGSVLANGLPKCSYGIQYGSPFMNPHDSEETYLYAKIFPKWWGCVKFEPKEDA